MADPPGSLLLSFPWSSQHPLIFIMSAEQAFLLGFEAGFNHGSDPSKYLPHQLAWLEAKQRHLGVELTDSEIDQLVVWDTRKNSSD